MAEAAPTTTSATIEAVAAPAAAAAPVTTEAVNPGSWTAGLNDDLKGYVGTKGFKDTAALADSYRNLEKLMGAPKDRLLTIPEKFYDDKGGLTPEAKAVYERLGAPKEVKDYDFKTAQGADQKTIDTLKSSFFENGVPKAAAEKIMANMNAFGEAQVAAAKETAALQHRQQETALKTEWGAAFEKNQLIAQSGVRVLGLKAEQIDAISSQLGHSATMKLMHQLGKSVGESEFINGRGATDVHEPAVAQAKMRELMSDKNFGQKLMQGDTMAKQQWENLGRMAYPGTKEL
jgi:hypothetical protein